MSECKRQEQHWLHTSDDLSVLYPEYSTKQCPCCGRYVYKTRSKPRKVPKGARNIYKGYRINPDYLIEIYESHGVIVNPQHYLCKRCNETPLNQLQFRHAQTKNIKTNKHIRRVLDYHKRRTKAKQKRINELIKNKKRIGIDTLSDAHVRVSCGLEKCQLQRIVDELDADDIHLNINHLFIACSIWYQDISYSYAAILFGYSDKCYISHLVSGVIIILFNNWCSKYLGAGYWTKDKIINEHVPDFVRVLYPNKNIIGCIDATYLYSQKSQKNYQYQKASYSNYKHLNLQKEHVFCTPDGYIIVADGPYFADGHNNDDILWDSIINDASHDIHEIFDTYPSDTDIDQDDDIPLEKFCVIADRGYKKCAKHPRYELLWPFAKKKKNNNSDDPNEADDDIKEDNDAITKQLTTEQSNHTRYFLSFLSLTTGATTPYPFRCHTGTKRLRLGRYTNTMTLHSSQPINT